MQVLQPKLELLQFCNFASYEHTSYSRQPDCMQQGPGRPSCAEHTAGNQITLIGATGHHRVEESPSSTVHSFQSRHQQDDWRLRPEHRFPINFWQEAHDFLVSVAVDRN